MSDKRKTSKQDGSRAPHLLTEGFGVPVAETDPHCFIVKVPKGSKGAVEIVESLGLQAIDHDNSEITRVVLPRPRWTAIRQEVQRVFNVRLRERNLKTSKWSVGDNAVDRLLGKELCVLAWAIENLEEESIPMAIRNWMALRPEERWWLFSMTAMHTGGVNDGDKGWRVALRYALGDVAQHEMFRPRDAAKRPNESPTLPTESQDLFSSDPAKE